MRKPLMTKEKGRAQPVEIQVGNTTMKKVATGRIQGGVKVRETDTGLKERKKGVISSMRKGEKVKETTRKIIETKRRVEKTSRHLKEEGKKVINLARCCQKVLRRMN